MITTKQKYSRILNSPKYRACQNDELKALVLSYWKQNLDRVENGKHYISSNDFKAYNAFETYRVEYIKEGLESRLTQKEFVRLWEWITN